MSRRRAEIGVIGGSGFYEFLDDVEELDVATDYGAPAAPLVTGQLEGRWVAFLPRHGRRHELPPHAINYRANIAALKELGVTRIIGPCAAGSLQTRVRRGDFVVADQLVDRTTGRKDTYFDGPVTTHVSYADPYCPELRPLAVAACSENGVVVHDGGTVVTIQGPRFSTRAESQWYTSAGWDVINMTQYPEAYLAREQEMCYVNISIITDYDAGIVGETEAVTAAEIVEMFKASNEKLRAALLAFIPRIPQERGCPCGTALQGARL